LSKVPAGADQHALYVVARRVLLDALDALVDQRDALVLVGAQAIYLRSGDADLTIALAAYTADGDLGIDPRRLSDRPLLEEAMQAAGFGLHAMEDRRQPGQWFRTERVGEGYVNIPVDLLIPEQLAGTGKSRRTANIQPHANMAARKVTGLELMTVDHEVMEVPSLDPVADPRRLAVKVAGPAALLVAKAYKINDRVADLEGSRSSDKDAGDVIRLMLSNDAARVAVSLRQCLAEPTVGETARLGLGYLRTQFGRPRGAGIEMAVRALAGSLPGDTIRGLAASYLAELAQFE